MNPVFTSTGREDVTYWADKDRTTDCATQRVGGACPAALWGSAKVIGPRPDSSPRSTPEGSNCNILSIWMTIRSTSQGRTISRQCSADLRGRLRGPADNPASVLDSGQRPKLPGLDRGMALRHLAESLELDAEDE